jgi:hypothetical protein
MFAITYDWMPFETETKTEAPTNHSIRINKKYSREEEFRSALDSYMAEYRRNRDLIANKPTGQLLKNQIPLGRRTAEMLRFQAWF